MRPSGLQELFPDLEPKDWPTYGQVDKDSVYWMLSPNRALPLKPTPPPFRNHGNYVVSVAELSRWLAEKAEEAGAYILTETARLAAARRGRRRARHPLGRQGPRQGRQAAGQLRAGRRRHRPGHRPGRGHLGPPHRRRDPRVRPRRRPRAAGVGARGQGGLEGPAASSTASSTRSAGRCATAPSTRSSAARGSTRWATTACRSASSSASTTPTPPSPGHDLLQQFKTSKLVRGILEGGERVAWGAKAIPEGGYWAMPKLIGAGHGHRRRRGRHGQRPGPQGHPLRHPRRDPGRRGDLRAAQGAARHDFSGYEQAVEDSLIGKELYESRNMKQPFGKGFFVGGAITNAMVISKGRFPGGRWSNHRDAESPVDDRRQEGRLSQARRQVHLRQALERLHHGQRDPRRRAQPHPRARERAARGGRGVGVDVPGRGLRGPRGRAGGRATST